MSVREDSETRGGGGVRGSLLYGLNSDKNSRVYCGKIHDDK